MYGEAAEAGKAERGAEKSPPGAQNQIKKTKTRQDKVSCASKEKES